MADDETRRANERRQRRNLPVLLVSDLDGTLIDHDEPLSPASAAPAAPHRNERGDAKLVAFEHAWRTQLAPRGSILVYSTGRSLTRFERVQREHRCLPTPHYLISAVGTVIYDFSCVNSGAAAHAEPDRAYEARLSEQYDRATVERAAQPYLDAGLLRAQPPSEMNAHKVSYDIDTRDAERVRTHVMPALRRALEDDGERRGRLRVKMVLSSDSKGAYLDILSQHAGKGASLVFLREKLGVPPHRCVVCGDSGNDIDLFLNGGECGVAVANARPELLHALEREQRPEHYVAHERCAAGVLDGLRHFGFLA